MQWMQAPELRELVSEIKVELEKLEQLEADITRGRRELERDPQRADIHYSNLALKLHNFYTDCERIFRIIASELNHALPSDFDWHKRLLGRMALEVEGTRPAVISGELRRDLEEFLGFRHVVRNIYGYELDPRRMDQLFDKYELTWQKFKSETAHFLKWMSDLAGEMEG